LKFYKAIENNKQVWFYVDCGMNNMQEIENWEMNLFIVGTLYGQGTTYFIQFEKYTCCKIKIHAK